MTQHWIDIANSDCIMIIGSNAAENHPVSFMWVLEAVERGAKLISVDPRFTRTSSLADIYVPIRSGTDIAFMGGLINHALTRGLIHRDYLATHTNAPFLVDPAYTFDDGLFGEIRDGKYTREHWGFQRDENGLVRRDSTLTDPHCVFQIVKRHFSRYDLETVSHITGAPPEAIEEVAETICSTHEPHKAATIMYAMGTTQHTHGTQNIRSYVILQLLLGNIGVAGGGINALRGESNVQGSTDHCLLSHILPGYLKCPTADDSTLQHYIEAYTPTTHNARSANWWSNTPMYIISLLKAFYGEHATAGNDFGYNFLPKRSADYSHIALFEAMHAGRIKGLVTLGQNPAVGGPNARLERAALERLEWLVSVDLWPTETAEFWHRDGTDPAKIPTEVFMLPAAASIEKEGSVTNSGRWAQWRTRAIDPPGDAKPDLWILTRLHSELKALHSSQPTPDPIQHVTWDHGDDPDLVAREINGRFLTNVEIAGTRYAKGDQVPSFSLLQPDGSTSSGNWLYCGSYTSENMMARRTASADPIGPHHEWAWCWPLNRRILYNRASCDAKGNPYAPQKPVISWDRATRKWTGDVPDGAWPPLENPDSTPDPAARYSFIMKSEGHACLFAPLADGPLPEHYEPLESPLDNPLSAQQRSPVIKIWRPDQVGDRSSYPIVATTYRVSEHWQAGAMTRNVPWLAELVPEPFVEISEELASEKKISHGDTVLVSSARAPLGITLKAMVTRRFKPFTISEKQVHQVGLIWHFGYSGRVRGDSANELTSHVGDANTQIPEFKSFLCNIRKVGP